MMNLIELDYDWEAERKRRVRYIRRQRCAKWFAIAIYALLAIGFILAIVTLTWVALNRERYERAAYNEGRYHVSREVALKMADQGVGMCARELIEDYRAARAVIHRQSRREAVARVVREPYRVAVGSERLTATAAFDGEVR